VSVEQLDPDVREAPRFESLAPVAFVEIDRYCAGCGYNLRTQAIRRDPRTQILITRCPECGCYHAAGDTTTAARVWLGRLGPLFLLAWLAVVLSAALGLFGLMASLSYGTLDELTTWQPISAATGLPATQPTITRTQGSWGTTVITYTTPSRSLLQVRPDPPHYAPFMALFAAGSFAVAGAMVLMLVVVFHHWRRWLYVLVAVAMPLAAAALVIAIWWDEAPHLLDWSLIYIGLHALVQLLGGLTGVAFGRPVARGLVRAFVPTSWRAPLAYLWLIDGKRPPGTADPHAARPC
jgi:hypothetical protein